MQRRSNPKIRRRALRAAFLLVLALGVTALCWCRWVYAQIERYAGQDQAAQVVQGARADAIGVFGAAEYDGRPSPVYRARLDHALVLTIAASPRSSSLWEGTEATSTTKGPWAASI